MGLAFEIVTLSCLGTEVKCGITGGVLTCQVGFLGVFMESSMDPIFAKIS